MEVPAKQPRITKKKVKVAEVIEAPVPVEEPVEPVEVKAECVAETLGDKIVASLDTVSLFVKKLKVLEAELKIIKSLYTKEHRKNTKKLKRNVSSLSHGFVKDVKISKALAEFLKVSADTLISRPKVTTAISLYVKEHGLANPEKKSIFKTDDVLEKILGKPRFLINKKQPELGCGFSYFNLQTYMKEHFIKE